MWLHRYHDICAYSDNVYTGEEVILDSFTLCASLFLIFLPMLLIHSLKFPPYSLYLLLPSPQPALFPNTQETISNATCPSPLIDAIISYNLCWLRFKKNTGLKVMLRFIGILNKLWLLELKIMPWCGCWELMFFKTETWQFHDFIYLASQEPCSKLDDTEDMVIKNFIFFTETTVYIAPYLSCKTIFNLYEYFVILHLMFSVPNVGH